MPDPASPRELAAAAAALAALAGAVLGEHVVGGGFLSDDWSNAAKAAAGLDRWNGLAAYRPGLALVLGASHALLGPIPGGHLAVGVVLSIAAAVCFGALLRSAGVGRLAAWTMAPLVLLFPWADATRLWATGAGNNLALVLAMLGGLVGLRALRTSTPRRGAAAHAGALLLYAAAVLTYEAVAPVLLGSAVLYRTRASWRRALPRAVADAAVVLGAAIFVAARTPRPPRPVDEWSGHAASLAGGALELLIRALSAVPGGGVGLAAAGGVALLLAGEGWAARRREGVATRPPARGPAGGRLPHLAGAGLFVVIAGYVAYVPASDAYVPLAPGLANRVNLVAAPGYVLLVWSAVAALAGLVGRSGGPGRFAAAALVAAGCLVLGAGYAHLLRQDAASYRRAAALQALVFDPLRASAARLPPGAHLYAFGQPVYAAPGVPVVRHWDGAGAGAVLAGERGTVVVPLYPGTRVICGANEVRPSGPSLGRAQAAPYRASFLLDARRGRVSALPDAGVCRRARTGVRPGPWLAAATLGSTPARARAHAAVLPP